MIVQVSFFETVLESQATLLWRRMVSEASRGH
jgi:hypothetical protein